MRKSSYRSYIARERIRKAARERLWRHLFCYIATCVRHTHTHTYLYAPNAAAAFTPTYPGPKRPTLKRIIAPRVRSCARNVSRQELLSCCSSSSAALGCWESFFLLLFFCRRRYITRRPHNRWKNSVYICELLLLVTGINEVNFCGGDERDAEKCRLCTAALCTYTLSSAKCMFSSTLCIYVGIFSFEDRCCGILRSFILPFSFLFFLFNNERAQIKNHKT